MEDGLLEFAVDSGRLLVHRIHNEFHVSLTTQLPEFNMTFNINLCLEDCESNSGSAPEQQDPPSYFLPLSSSSLHHSYFDARDSSESPPLRQGEFFVQH